MPEYVKGEERRYFPAVIAALIIGAIAIASLIFSLINAGDNSEQDLGIGDDVVKLNPDASLATPNSAPNVAPPTSPPPSN